MKAEDLRGVQNLLNNAKDKLADAADLLHADKGQAMRLKACMRYIDDEISAVNVKIGKAELERGRE